MTTRGQVLRSSITGNVPATNSRWPGEIWSNFPDKQIGVIDASKVAQPLVGVRFFSTNANYVAGDFVVQGGGIYRAKVAVTAGAFNPASWAQVGGSVLVSDTPPGGANPGDLWFDSVGGQLFVYYNDGNTSQWVAASNQNVGGLFLPLTGGALSGALTINNAVAGTASLQVNAPNGPANITLNSSQGQFRNIVGQTSGSLRWSMALGDNTTESGSNSGSNFTLTCLSDDLSAINTPLSISRALGHMVLNGNGATPFSGFGATSGHARLHLNKAGTGTSNVIIGTSNGVARWAINFGDGATETGSGNTGSDFSINRYTDAGAFVDFPLTISRATGTATFAGAVFAGATIRAPNIQGTSSVSVNIPTVATTAPIYGQLNGTNRWGVFLGNGQAETGSNAGSNFQINAYNDAGGPAPMGTPLTINRSNGGAVFGYSVQADGFVCRPGQGGAPPGYLYNFNWTTTNLALWIGTTNVGNVSVVSDYRTKQDVAELPSMWETLKALKPISYTHKDYTPPGVDTRNDDGDDMGPMVKADGVEHWGFVAHELQETLTDSAATGYKDAPDYIQSPNPWTVIAALTKTLQEAMSRIEALEAGAGA